MLQMQVPSMQFYRCGIGFARGCYLLSSPGYSALDRLQMFFRMLAGENNHPGLSMNLIRIICIISIKCQLAAYIDAVIKTNFS